MCKSSYINVWRGVEKNTAQRNWVMRASKLKLHWYQTTGKAKNLFETFAQGTRQNIIYKTYTKGRNWDTIDAKKIETNPQNEVKAVNFKVHAILLHHKKHFHFNGSPQNVLKLSRPIYR